ncbi:MAG: TRIC cation channel family protein [Solobacterium sp.]|nr:TRIC cation channel family protein [Solobacterium sp.]
MENLMLFLELCGTAAFAVAGSITAMKVKADVFGVMVLGIITATGGGVIRDVILGLRPPGAFVNPRYVITAAIVSLGVFLTVYFREKNGKRVPFERLQMFFLYMDSIGLGLFTAYGVIAASQIYGTDNSFLLVFSGVVSGVGGGLLRDMIVDHLPDIFVKHIYALASIAGSVICLWLLRTGLAGTAVYISAAAVVMIRLLAAHYKWNLWKIEHFHD